MTQEPAGGADPAPRPAGRRSFARAALATYATNLATAVLSLVNVLITARVLGPEGRGEVALLITIATLVSAFGALGVQESNANMAGRAPRARGRLATNSVLLAIVLGAAAAGVLVALIAVFPSISAGLGAVLLGLALGSVPVVILKLYLSFILQADYHFGVTNLAWLAGPVTTLTVNGALAATGRLSVLSAILAWVGGQTLGMVVVIAAIHRRTGFARPDLELAEMAVGFGVKAHVPRIMNLANFRIHQWFVGALAGPRELGLFSVAVAWTEVLFYLPGVLVLILRPDIVRADTDREAGALAARAFRLSLLLSAPMAVVLVLAAPWLCTIVFGEDFAGSVPDLRILALAAFGICAAEVLGTALTARRKPLLAAAGIAVAFVATLVLNILLIPVYGGVGAAIATVLALTLGGIALCFLFTRAQDVKPGQMVPHVGELGWLRRQIAQRLGRGRPAV